MERARDKDRKNMISYAQNFEDVMLWRALKHIENGFYVDVGAAWPDEHSVTNLFYQNGWHGINFEPNPSFITKYKELRPNDINLQMAVSDKEGDAEFHFIDGTGLSSLDESIANSHDHLGFKSHASLVEVTTLAKVFLQHCQNQEIHFLKVDIEGYEKQALLGNDWNRFRPWIVAVEATLPMSQVENHSDWEYILLEADYIFAYADGLNRFYVSKEHSELLESFKYPPNVFDEFILVSQVNAEQRATQAEQNANEANARATQAEQHIELLLNSNSWKIIAPLRKFADFLRWFKTGAYSYITFAPGSRPRRVLKSLVSKIISKINENPKIKSKLLKILNNFPSLKVRLIRIGSPSTIDNSKFKIQNLELNHLSPQAKKIYFDLKNAIEQRKNEVQK